MKQNMNIRTNFSTRRLYKREEKERWLGPGKVMFQDGKGVFIRHGSSFVRVSPNRLLKNPPSFNYQTPDDSVQSLKNDSQTSKITCQSETNVKSQSTVSETLSPTIPNDSPINAPSTDTPSKRLNKSNHTDTQSNETSSTTCTPTSCHSTTTGSKSILDAGDAKFNCQEYELKTVVKSHEMKPKSLQLPSKDDTVIYRLKPEGDLMKPYLPGEVVKQRDSIVVGLMLNQPLVINNIVLILKMLNGRNKMSMLS